MFKRRYLNILFIFIAYSLVGFSGLERYVELEGFFNARSASKFRTTDANIKFVAARGTRAEIVNYQKFSSGNYGLEVKVINGEHKGEKVWLYYKSSNPNMQLYKDVPKEWGAISSPEAASPESASGVEVTKTTSAYEAPTQPETNQDGEVVEKINQSLPPSSVTSEADGEVCTNCSIENEESPVAEKNLTTVSAIVEATNHLNKPYCSKPVTPQKTAGAHCAKPSKCAPPQKTDLEKTYSAEYKAYIESITQQAAEVTGVDPAILMSIMQAESGFHPFAKNSGGDVGIAQFQESTAHATLKYYYQSIYGKSYSGPKPNKRRPSECNGSAYPKKVASACLKKLINVCNTEEYRYSLYCPNFSIYLMASHVKQIKDSSDRYMVKVNGEKVNVRNKLVPNGDPIAESRFILSVYNRGYRIINSAVHSFDQNKKWPSAADYGELWDANRANTSNYKSRISDPFGGGNLQGHNINRCYVWKIAGICGGTQGSYLDQYTKDFCGTRIAGGQ